MDPRDGKMTPWQLAMLLVTGVASTSILFLPGNAATFALRDGWLAPIAALPVGALVVWIAAGLARRFPNDTIVEYAPKLVGTFAGKIVGALLVWYFFHLSALVTREFGDFLLATTLPKAPMSVILAMTMLSSALAVRNGPESLGRIGELFTPFALLLILSVISLASARMSFSALLPFMEFGPLPVLRAGALTQGFLGEIVVLTVLFPSVNSLKGGIRASYWTLLGIVGLLTLAGVATIAVFGDLTSRFTFPFFALARVTSVGPILARIDPIVIGFWIGGVALKATLFLYAAVVGLTQLVGLADYRPLALPMAALVGVFAMAQMPNVVDFGNLISFIWPVYSPIFEWIIPGLLLIVAVLRGRGNATV